MKELKFNYPPDVALKNIESWAKTAKDNEKKIAQDVLTMCRLAIKMLKPKQND